MVGNVRTNDACFHIWINKGTCNDVICGSGRGFGHTCWFIYDGNQPIFKSSIYDFFILYQVFEFVFVTSSKDQL